MKLKIREITEKVDYVNSTDQGFDFFRLKIIQIVKYIILHTDD
jgi:hypothetical protein